MKSKGRLLTLIIFILSFAFIKEVSASATIELTLNNTIGSYNLIASENVISGLKCGGLEIGTRGADGERVKYVDTAHNIEIYYSSSRYFAKFNENYKTDESTEPISIVCTYDEIKNVDVGLGNIKYEDDSSNRLTLKITPLPMEFNMEFPIVFEPLLNDTQYYAVGPGTPFAGEVYQDLKASNYRSKIEYSSGAKENIILQDDGDHIIFKLKDGYTLKDVDETYSITLNFKYKGNDTYIKFNFTIKSFASVTAAGLESCKWNSTGETKWEQIGTAEQAGFSSPLYKYKAYYKNKLILPDCTTSDSELYTFTGWTYSTNATMGSGNVGSATCQAEYAAGEVDINAIRARTISHGGFVACFALKPNAILSVGFGTINNIDTSKWKDFGDNSGPYYKSYIHSFTNDSDTVTLPNVEPVNGSGLKSTFLGWSYENADCNGEYLAANTSINSSKRGRYYACFENKETIDNHSTPSDGHKKVYLNETSTFSSQYLPDGKIKLSDAAKEYLEVDGNKIKGIKATPGTTEVDVYVTGTYEGVSDFELIYKFRVIDKNLDPSYSGEGDVITLDGETYDLTGFLQAGQKIDQSCGKFNISTDPDTSGTSGIDILSYGGVKLRAHFYTVKTTCDGKTNSFKAVCLDPGREEPDYSNENVDGSWYYKDTDMNPESNYVDRVTAYLYNKADNFDVNAKNDLAAAEFSLRLVAILTGDDKNNTSAGLAKYYEAYVKISKNMKKYIKSKNGNKLPSELEKWSKIMGSSYDEKFFCDGNCSGVNSTILKKAYGYLYNGLKYKANTGFTPTITVNDMKTTWTDKTHGKYTKTIDGTLSGLNNSTQDPFLDMAVICPECGKGVEVKLYVGRDANHLVEYFSKVNYFTVTYKEFAGHWYSGEDRSYDDLRLISDDGKIFFKYVITGDIKVIAGGAGGLGNTNYDPSTGGKIDYDIYLAFGDDTKEFLVDTGVALPGQSVNIQRMVMFAKPHKTPSEGHTDGGTGHGSPQKIYSTAPSQLVIDYDRGGESKRIKIVYTVYRIGPVLPNCDLDAVGYNYNDKSTFNASLFRSAGCCAFVLDENSELYNNVCKVTCAYNSFTPVCQEGEGSGSEVGIEKLSIHEGKQKKADGTEKGYMTCVYVNKSKLDDASDMNSDDAKKDSAGNTYLLSQYKDNDVCSVYCKEDWDFNLPDFTNHTGKNAVKAGQYFEISHKQIAITGTRTCVTSYIDTNKWAHLLDSYSEAMVTRFNNAQKIDSANDIIGGLNGSGKVTTGVNGTGDNVKFGTIPTTDVEPVKEATKCGKHDGHDMTPDGDKCKYDYYTDEPCSSNPSKCSGRTTGTYRDHHSGHDDAKECKYTYTQTVNYSVVNITYNHGSVTNTEVPVSGTGTKDITEAGKCKDRKLTTAEATELEKAAVKNASTAGGPTNWLTYRSLIKKLIEDMNKCQRFELVTNNKQARIITGNNPVKDTDIALSVVDVMTVFDPKISYSYDEPEYMSKIGSNNQLYKVDSSVEYTDSYAFYSVNGFDPYEYYSSNEQSGTGTQYVGEYGDSTARAAYCTAGGSGTGTTGGSKESGGHSYHWEAEPNCHPINPPYFKNANYIKRSLTFEAEYQKDYYWFKDELSDFKEYAKTVNDAISITASNNKNADTWNYYGSSNVRNLVFPVSSTAPRNLYKYQFIYTNVGMYNNNVTTGRVLGTTTSVVPNNKRTCFYEVVEDICYCCGDASAYVVETIGNRNIVSRDGSSGDNKVIDDFLKKGGKYSLDVEKIQSCTDNNCNKEVSKGASSNIIVSSVSLGTIKENLGREPGVNWKDATHYTLEGKIYVTDKGAKLLENIEKNAESIYDNSPEYSYEITPSDMAAIRSINSADGYQVRTNSLIATKDSSVKANTDNISSWKSSKSAITFNHFRSKFLDEFMSSRTTSGVNTIVDTTEICYVLADDFAKSGLDKVYDSKGVKISFYNGAYNCRWVDYVGKVVPADSSTVDEDVKPLYRLSFK